VTCVPAPACCCWNRLRNAAPNCARDVLKRQLLAAPDSAETRSLRGLLEQSGQWLRPGTLLVDDGYGLPLADEQALLSGRGHCQCAGGAGVAGAARAAAPAAAGAQREEMDAIDANLAALGAHLRTQARLPATGAAVR
jgi:hypothetical protein